MPRVLPLVASLVACEVPTPTPTPTPTAVPTTQPARLPLVLDDGRLSESVALTQLRPLSGPWATLDDYCAHVTPSELDDEDGHRLECRIDHPEHQLTGAAPFDEVRLFRIEGLDFHTQLAVRMDRDWWVLGNAVWDGSTRLRGTLDVGVLQLAVVNRMLRLRTVRSRSTKEVSPSQYESDRSEVLLLCGVTGSGPSCTREWPLRGTYERHEQQLTTRYAAFDITLEITDRITVTGDTSLLELFDIEPLVVGRYPLEFQR